LNDNTKVYEGTMIEYQAPGSANIFRDLLIKHEINLVLWGKPELEAPFQSDLRLEEA
jgi:hypothetical protein